MDLRTHVSASLQHPIAARLVLQPLVTMAYRYHRWTGTTPTIGYSAMRKLFGSPRSQYLDSLADRAAAELPDIELDSIEGIVSDDLNDVVAGLCDDGLVVLDTLLSDIECDELAAIATSTACTTIGRVGRSSSKIRFDPTQPIATRYDLPETVLVDNPAVQALLADRSIMAVSKRYLRGTPVQDLVAMWWTSSLEHDQNQAAQQFHFDLDRLRFLKFFVYLTDVTDDTGPHQFVRGSHRALPIALRQDKRYSDAEVHEHYPNDVVTITGPRGTMFFADTRGLHRGLPVREGHRLVFQMEYTTSLFGAPTERQVVANPSDQLTDAARRFPDSYGRFDLRHREI